jgi:hypothetical protein
MKLEEWEKQDNCLICSYQYMLNLAYSPYQTHKCPNQNFFRSKFKLLMGDLASVTPFPLSFLLLCACSLSFEAALCFICPITCYFLPKYTNLHLCSSFDLEFPSDIDLFWQIVASALLVQNRPLCLTAIFPLK